MTVRDIGTARSVARDIIRRVVKDEEFAARLRKEPRATLLEAGLLEWAVDDFIANDLGIESDVAGYTLSECRVTSLLWVEGDGTDLQ